MSKYDYDKLPTNIQNEIADNIIADHMENSNKYYPKVVIKEGIYSKYIKRIIDLVIASIALLVFFPVNVIIAIVTFFDVGSPIFFVQKRMGKDGHIFSMIKFRNMTNEKDENGVLLRSDYRVTKWGKFTRKYSLDELLNFICIFKGDMSIIGPRPLPLVYKDRFNEYHNMRHAVKPGLDCPLRDRFENDVWYAEHVSFATDMRLFFLLVRRALFGSDMAERAEGVNEGTFVGYYEDGRVMDSHHIPDHYYEQAIERNNWQI